MEKVLELFKIDMGISHDVRDAYFSALIEGCRDELSRKGIHLDDKNDIEDTMLLADYSAWRYRKRNEDVGVPQNIVVRIRQRQMNKRGE